MAIPYLAGVARLGDNVEVGDRFRTFGPRPCCVEYSAPAPSGERWGGLPRGRILLVLEVAVVRLPESGGRPGEDAIVVRVPSYYRPGEDAWVNLCRGSTRFCCRVRDDDPHPHEPLHEVSRSRRSRPY